MSSQFDFSWLHNGSVVWTREGSTVPERFEVPDDDQIAAWLMDSMCDALDGCQVECDGMCPHGYPAWPVALGLI